MRLELFLAADYANITNVIAKIYVEIAIRLVDELVALQKEQSHGSQAES